MPINYQIEYRHLNYFLTVAETLHFRKAAERLFISQPGLSRQIKELETKLGLALFERHNRHVKLTPAGLYLKTALNKNLKELDVIINHAKLLNDGKHGQLNFGYVGSAMQKIIPELLLKFTKTNPNILLSLNEMDNNQQIKGLLSQDIDIGFVRLEKAPKGINIHPVLKEPFCLVLPKNYPITTDSLKSIKALKNEHYILFNPEYSASYYNKVMDIFHYSGFTPTVSHHTIHAGSIYKLVENGFGISIVPESLKTNNTKIKFITLNNIPQRTTLSAAWSASNNNPILNRVLTLIRNKKTK